MSARRELARSVRQRAAKAIHRADPRRELAAAPRPPCVRRSPPSGVRSRR